jgi:hypothetical protein
VQGETAGRDAGAAGGDAGAAGRDAGAAGGDAGAAGGDAGAAGGDVGAAGAPVLPVVANIVYPDGAPNLIVNGDFEDYQDPNVPAGWSVDEIYDYAGMFSPVAGWRGLGVQFVRNAQGRHLLSQTVQVAPGHRYTAQVIYNVVATDSRSGGLYIVDPSDGTIIGSDDIDRPSNGWRIFTVTFDSGSRTQVNFDLGYLSGMNGTAIYDGARVFDADTGVADQYQTTYRDVIGIPAQPVDALVPALSDYVTSLLASPQANRLAHRDAYAAELPYYLYSFLSAPDGDGSRDAWCQRTSLALGELLAMYGVPTRQIHASPIQHEFIEYFDGSKWVVFDPYYGIRYVLAGVRLGVADVVAAGFNQISIEVPTRERLFLLELGYLTPIWGSGSFTTGITMP